MPKVRRQKHIGHRDASGDPGRRPRSLTSVTSTEPPLRNPQATLLGLPAELRLLIYEFYLTDSLIHLHPRPIHCKENDSPKFIWRACRATDPRSALLCKNPTWSATCRGKDRCHTKKLNTFPILIVCKAIYYEIKGIRGSIFSRVAVSLNAHDWTTFIEQSPKSLLANLRRLTLCGFHSYGLNLYMDNRSSPLAKIFYNIPKILPQLEEIGFQGKILESVIGMYDPRKKGYNIAGRQQFRDWDLFRCCFSKYNPNITVVFYGEAMLSDKGNGEIGKCVVIRKGKEDGVLDGTVGCTWDDGDVEVWEEQVLVLDEKSREFWGTWEMHDLYWRKGGRCKCV